MLQNAADWTVLQQSNVNMKLPSTYFFFVNFVCQKSFDSVDCNVCAGAITLQKK